MRILFIGDVMARSGRDGVTKYLPGLKEKLKADVVILNGENSAKGIGLTEKIIEQFYKDGADVITGGNHVWGQREIISYIGRDPKLLRPINYPKGAPGNGHYLHRLPDGRTILVIHALGRLFMDALDDPFALVDAVVKGQGLGKTVNAIFVDFHAEATSEKMAFAHFLDGRVSAVVGTHTHVPTADAQIFTGGTAYQTDAGMCGDYDSVIGAQKDLPIQRFTRKMPTDRLEPAEGEATVCGTFIETDDRTGLARRIEPVRIGGRLKELFRWFKKSLTPALSLQGEGRGEGPSNPAQGDQNTACTRHPAHPSAHRHACRHRR